MWERERRGVKEEVFSSPNAEREMAHRIWEGEEGKEEAKKSRTLGKKESPTLTFTREGEEEEWRERITMAQETGSSGGRVRSASPSSPLHFSALPASHSTPRGEEEREESIPSETRIPPSNRIEFPERRSL